MSKTRSEIQSAMSHWGGLAMSFVCPVNRYIGAFQPGLSFQWCWISNIVSLKDLTGEGYISLSYFLTDRATNKTDLWSIWGIARFNIFGIWTTHKDCKGIVIKIFKGLQLLCNSLYRLAFWPSYRALLAGQPTFESLFLFVSFLSLRATETVWSFSSFLQDVWLWLGPISPRDKVCW